MTRFPTAKILTFLRARGRANFALELLAIGIAYFALAQIDLTLAQSSAVPIAVAPGFGLATVLLRGWRVWPAIFAAALAAGAPTGTADALVAGTILALSIAAAHTIGAVGGGYLIKAWAGGREAFETTAGAAKFALVTLGPSTLLAALIGVGSMCLVGAAGWTEFGTLWATWWLRAATGALVVAPVIVLATSGDARFDQEKAWLGGRFASGTTLLAALIVGFLVFGPQVEGTAARSALVVLAVAPLVWAALRRGPRDTALCALVLAGFAAFGAFTGNGPFAATPDEAFLATAIFVISATVLGLVLSADIAQRQHGKARLNQQEQNLRALLSHADVGIAQIDTSGRFKLVNSRYCDMVQRPAAELLQSRIHELIDADGLCQVSELVGKTARTGESFAVETKVALPDGTHRWIKSNVAAIFDRDRGVRYLVAAAEDVTARRQAEENLIREHRSLLQTVDERSAILNAEIEQRKRVEDALKHDIAERRKTQEALMQSESRFRTVIQGITDHAIFMLDRDGCITNWNLGAQRIHQYTAAEIIGRHFSLFYTEEEQQGGGPARAVQAAAYEGKYAVEGWRVRRDESQFWASVVIEAIRDEVGTLVGFVNITRDMTERREAQASLERAQEQLSQSQKMEALGQLTGSIAHDFNNLLMIVSGHAQLLRRRLTDPKHLQAIEAVHAAANRGESLTRQLLAFSRRQPINPVVTDLNERIQAVHDMLVGSLRGNVELKCDIAPDVWPVEVDIAELELALVNIAVNARDAMPGGGVITLSALNVTLKKNDGIDQLEGEFVALGMTDTGVGIAPDVLPRIFEPFYTTKALGKGTGLGLAQVYGFSHQSGGTVVATSTVGSGTTITIYLPRRQAALVKVEAAPPAQPIEPGQGTILIVEDNAEVADVTASLLEQLGYRSLRADNATDALNRLQQHGDEIMLVFSDIVMPGSMNGIALAQEISNRYPQLPVLLTSGYSDVVQTVGSQFRILRKPFQLSTLEKSIREALEGAREHDSDGRVLPFTPRRQRRDGTIAR